MHPCPPLATPLAALLNAGSDFLHPLRYAVSNYWCLLTINTQNKNMIYLKTAMTASQDECESVWLFFIYCKLYYCRKTWQTALGRMQEYRYRITVRGSDITNLQPLSVLLLNWGMINRSQSSGNHYWTCSSGYTSRLVLAHQCMMPQCLHGIDDTPMATHAVDLPILEVSQAHAISSVTVYNVDSSGQVVSVRVRIHSDGICKYLSRAKFTPRWKYAFVCWFGLY